MNSSTKPPQTSSHKFQFDMDFALEEERQRLEVLRQEEMKRQKALNEELASKMVMYTEDEVEKMRAEAYQSGYSEGEASAKNALEKSISELVDRAVGKLRGLIETEEARTKSAQDVAMTMTLATLKKIWPQVIQSMGQTLVEETIRQSLELNPQETRIVVRVHDTMLDAVVERLPHLKDQQAFAGKVIVLADESVAAGDCKIEWADGGLERLSRTLSRHLDEAMTRILARMSMPAEKETNTETTERMSS